jgi:hypothetical protein
LLTAVPDMTGGTGGVRTELMHLKSYCIRAVRQQGKKYKPNTYRKQSLRTAVVSRPNCLQRENALLRLSALVMIDILFMIEFFSPILTIEKKNELNIK